MKVCLLLISLVLIAPQSLAQDVVINEVVSSNGTTIADEDGDFEDWVELYNAGSTAVNLEGFYLSDDESNPQRWAFPVVTLQPGAFLLVWASGKDRTSGIELHTNFSIAQAGEVLILSAPDGSIVDEVAPTFIPRDRSYGRSPDGADDWVFFLHPTPGTPNTSPIVAGFLEAPSSSVEPGFHAAAFDLQLSSEAPDAVIHYTLDGSVPTVSSPIYTGPIQIRDRTNDPNAIAQIQTSYDWRVPPSNILKGTVVRAVARAAGYADSPVASYTYLVGSNLAQRYQLPIASISIDPDSLFDHHRGIYVPGAQGNPNSDPPYGNYMERGADWERPANLEFFDTAGTRVASLGAGLRIHGGWSRSFRMKSLRIYFRSEYDEQNELAYPIFPAQERANFKRLILRNSGNDFGYSMMRDGMMQRLVRHLRFDTQDHQPMAVFINGEFWGLHNLRERFDDRYVENVFGVPTDEIDMLELDAQVVYGEAVHYNQLLQDIEARVSFDRVEERMDVDGYIEYQLSQIYFDNRDWPGNNIRFWRKRTAEYQAGSLPGHDGRWRWMMYDTDFGFGLYGSAWANNATNNTLRHATGQNPLNNWAAHPSATRFFRGLLLYPEFRTRFLNGFADHLNSTFRPARVRALIDEMQTEIRPIIAEHSARWGTRDVQGWESEIEIMRRFADDRPAIQRTHLVNNFQETSGSSRLTVNVSNPSHGKLQVNSLLIDADLPGIQDASRPYPWDGEYFRNVPVTVVAHPTSGYRVVEWEGLSGATGDTVTVTLTANRTITSVFERYVDPQPSAHVLADAPYAFSSWSSASPAGTYPPNMEFRQSRQVDPPRSADFPDPYVLPYDMTSTTRIEGLDDLGIAFINTGNASNLVEGASGRDLGAAVLGLDTRDCGPVLVTWTGTTIRTNSRDYALRLQYRIDDLGPFHDVRDGEDFVVQYERGPIDGHAQTFANVRLPEIVSGQPYVQLRWHYHHREGTSGPRAMLGLGGVNVTCEVAAVSTEDADRLPHSFTLHPAYPNPFDRFATVEFELPEPTSIRLILLNVLGQVVRTAIEGELAAGRHDVSLDAGSLPSGLYFLRLEAGPRTATRSVVVVH
jgi:hypothetical protein